MESVLDLALLLIKFPFDQTEYLRTNEGLTWEHMPLRLCQPILWLATTVKCDSGNKKNAGHPGKGPGIFDTAVFRRYA